MDDEDYADNSGDSSFASTLSDGISEAMEEFSSSDTVISEAHSLASSTTASQGVKMDNDSTAETAASRQSSTNEVSTDEPTASVRGEEDSFAERTAVGDEDVEECGLINGSQEEQCLLVKSNVISRNGIDFFECFPPGRLGQLLFRFHQRNLCGGGVLFNSERNPPQRLFASRPRNAPRPARQHIAFGEL